MSVESTQSLVASLALIVSWVLLKLVAEGVPLIVMESDRTLSKLESLDKVEHILSNYCRRHRVLIVDPGGEIVCPFRHIRSIEHSALLCPLGVWNDPLPVNLGGIIPVTLKSGDSDREL